MHTFIRNQRIAILICCWHYVTYRGYFFKKMQKFLKKIFSLGFCFFLKFSNKENVVIFRSCETDEFSQ